MKAEHDSPASRLPMFPLGTVLLPGALLPLHVFEGRYRRMMSDCLDAECSFGVVLITRGSEVGGGDQRASVGTEAHIQQAVELPDGRWSVVASGGRRVIVDSWLPEEPYPEALVRPAGGDEVEPSMEVLEDAGRAVRRALALLSELGHPSHLEDPLLREPEDPVVLGWRLCGAAPLGPLDRQRILEIDDVDERLLAVTELTEQVVDDLHRMLSEGGSS